ITARAGPTRHQTRDDAGIPWTRSSGGDAGSPQVRVKNGIPCASTTRSTDAGGSSRTATTPAGRSATDAVMGAGRLTAGPYHAEAGARDVRESGRHRHRRFPMANQFVVELKNEPGALAILAEALAARGIDLRAIGGGGIGGSGHIIMTTADDDGAKAVLDEGGYTYIEGEAILTEVDDPPGGQAPLSRELADAGVNIYGHLFLGRWGDRAMFAFVVDDPDKARPILERKG